MASAEFGFDEPLECAEWIVSTQLTRKQLELLAGHLTIGETYFFRDPSGYEALQRTIIPELIAARASNSRSLRFWCAGCCTGEEAYTLAIVLNRVLPNADGWNASILATDVNPRFLHKARSGTYTSWSFRAMDGITKERYFEETQPGSFQVIPCIKQMVAFAPLNLVADIYPSLTTNTNAMDVILCRNVLMYFSREQARKVVCKLSECLLQGAYLFTSAAEASSELFAPLQPQTFPGTVVYRKQKEQNPETYRERIAPEKSPAPREKAKSIQTVSPVPSPPQTARSLANEGKLEEALKACDEGIAHDKLKCESHYLRGIILQEQGKYDEAMIGLRRALFLDRDFVLAHFAMANLMLRQSRMAEAERHLEQTRTLLRKYDADAELPESEGLTAGRLLAMLETLQEVRS